MAKTQKREKFEVLIIGAGPAGLTAALYAGRAGRKVLVLEKVAVGGQMLETHHIRNYPGILGVSGPDLAQNMQEQIEKIGVEVRETEVLELKRKPGKVEADESDWFEVKTEDGVVEARAVIISAGVTARRMEVEGEEKLVGKGVSFCTTCDAPLFAGKTVAVYGGGNSALYGVIELAKICKKVILICRSKKLKAETSLVLKARELENVDLHLGMEIVKVLGKERVTGVKVVTGEEESKVAVDGLFVQIGKVADTNWCDNLVKRDAQGFIITDENCYAGTPGLYAAGDVRAKAVRQIATAVADGATAALAVEKALEED